MVHMSGRSGTSRPSTIRPMVTATFLGWLRTLVMSVRNEWVLDQPGYPDEQGDHDHDDEEPELQ